MILSFSLCFYFSGQILSCWLFGTSWIKLRKYYTTNAASSISRLVGQSRSIGPFVLQPQNNPTKIKETPNNGEKEERSRQRKVH